MSLSWQSVHLLPWLPTSTYVQADPLAQYAISCGSFSGALIIVYLQFTGKEGRQGEGGQEGVRGDRGRRRQGKVQIEGAQVPAVEVEVAGRSQGKKEQREEDKQGKERLSYVGLPRTSASSQMFVRK